MNALTPTLETQIRETETMKLRDLSKPQWDAALEAARVLATSSPHSADARRAWREANSRFAAMLPEGADAKQLIMDALRWDATNTIAAACAGIPNWEARA